MWVLKQGSHSLGYKKFQDFSGLSRPPEAFFPGPCRKSAMFKYGNKQQLKSLGERCKLCQRSPRRNPGRKSIYGIPAVQKTYLMATTAWTCLFETKNCPEHHCLPNFRTFQDLASIFPGLSRTEVIFQDFPGPGNLPLKITGLSRRRGNPVKQLYNNAKSGKKSYHTLTNRCWVGSFPLEKDSDSDPDCFTWTKITSYCSLFDFCSI